MADIPDIDFDDLLHDIGCDEWLDEGVDTTIPDEFFEGYPFSIVYIECEERDEMEERDWSVTEIELTAEAHMDGFDVIGGITVEAGEKLLDGYNKLLDYLHRILHMKKRRITESNPNMME